MSAIRASIFVSLAMAGVALATPGAGGGNVNGEAEQVIISKIQECKILEDNAAALTNGKDGALTAEEDAAVDAKLDEAMACLDQALADIEARRAGFQASTDADGAKAHLEAAKKEDEKAKTRANSGKKVRVRIDRANDEKDAAQDSMQGKHEQEDQTSAVIPANTSNCAYRFHGGPRNASEAMSWAADEREAAASRKAKAAAAAPGKRSGPPNYYLAFTGKGPSATGFAFFNMGRELRGPFEAHHSAGFMSPSSKAEAALGSAFSCMEFDVIGSNPLQFISICGRFTAGGFQAFASSRTSSSLGQVFLPGVRVGTFKTTYDGLTFTCFVKPEGAPDSAYQQFATYVHDQGTSLKWVGGVGGAQLGPKAEVGIDDVVIDAR